MILTVTLNAAVDVTYQVDELVPHGSHRVLHTTERAGGKGVNVSRVLAALGHDTVVTGLVGGAAGEQFRAELRAAGLADQLLPIAGETRRTVTVASRADGDATVFNQAGPDVSRQEWDAFTALFTQLARDAEVVVLAGSLPPGLLSDSYAELTHLARAAGASTLLDTSGPALRDALSAAPDLVKPNAAELLEVTGCRDIPGAAGQLRAMGARAIVASQGPEGLSAYTVREIWQARPPELVWGNPTGAGDACVAALAVGMAEGSSWPDRLRDAVALSAAAVLAPIAGDFDADAYHRFQPDVILEQFHASGCH
ncbi:1-phosphofructokinase family hexose kinase [Streptacidiphilus cavernicola]|uniref:1-phosphofructokinase family hexose kinase n=1 Tax=Streptacidiphilus cavernicola TaxID=3342716 RepID=A0ABV6VNE9_9ACTN